VFSRVKANVVNLLGVAFPLGIICAAYLLHLDATQKGTWLFLIFLALAASAFAAFFNYWRLLKITEAPVSTIAAVAQGYVELHGVASTGKLLKTPYHGIPCVWYRAWAFANRREQGYSSKIVDNRLLEYLESHERFQLQDSTGTCTVDPKGAEIIFAKRRTFLKNEHRYVEEYLPAGKSLYVLGQLDTRHEYFNENAVSRDVSTTLAELKRQPQKLLNQYDRDRNGQIETSEWELARHDAIAQVRAKHAMHAFQGDFTLSKPADGHLFLISAQSPQALLASYRHWAVVHFAIVVTLLLSMLKFS